MEQEARTILVVDDHEPDRVLLKTILQRAGYEVVLACDGAEAVDRALALKPHVVVTDLAMPVMDGLVATRTLRSRETTRFIPIIMISAHGEPEDLKAGLDAGADEYIIKPIRREEFLLRVASMCRLREAQLTINRTNESLQRQTQTLARLYQFSEEIVANSSVEEICKRTVEAAADLLDCRRVSLLLPDATRTAFRFGYAIGIDESFWRVNWVPINSPVAGRVFQTQHDVVVNQSQDQSTHQGRYEGDGYLSVPLFSTALRSVTGPVGVLNATDRRTTRDFDADDLQIVHQLAQTAAMAIENAHTRQQLDETRDSVIFSLARLSEYRHQETGMHLERVSALSVSLAEYLADDPRIPETIDQQFILDIGRAAPLHDIGKVAIPDHILLKPAALTDAEFDLLKNHTNIGAETLESVIRSGHEISFIQMAQEVARHHHERFDGTGYPDGLAGDAIPLAARIVCLADSYDAIRMPREYKPSRSHADATREILLASQTQFDPRLVQAYCALENVFRQTYEALSEEQTRLRKPSPEQVAVPAGT